MKIIQHRQNTKWNISAKMEVSYTIVEYPTLFSSNDQNIFGENINSSTEQKRRLIIIDKNVDKFYGDKVISYFSKHGIEIKKISMKTTEKDKTITAVFTILKEFDNFKLLRRKEPIIAIGGGVLLDIVGMAASLYRRGAPYIRVPTTLIGMIDAGIGVKTGVNFNNHKNRAGTYYEPLVSYIDISFLETLDTRHISNGLAEILKIGLIKDVSLFALLEKYGKTLLTTKFQNLSISKTVIHKAIEGMLEDLEPNLWEKNLERLVDFGHTFSGVLEMKALPHLSHGEAVSIDMAYVSILAYHRKLITEHELSRIINIMRSMRLPYYHKLCEPDIMYNALVDTTSHRDGLQRFPIPIGIGTAIFVNDITYQEIKLASYTLKNM